MKDWNEPMKKCLKCKYLKKDICEYFGLPASLYSSCSQNKPKTEAKTR